MSTRRARKTTPPVSALFLDIGGILLTNGWDTDDRAAAVKTFGLDAEETEQRHHLNFETHELGKLSLDEYLRRVIFYEPRAFSKEDFTAFMQSRSKPYPDMLAYVRELKARHRLKILAVSNEGRMLMFPLKELPELAKGKGNKIIGIPSDRAESREEYVVDVVVINRNQQLKVVAGKRHIGLKFSDLEHYMGERGRRGAMLPRGFQKVDAIEVVD